MDSSKVDALARDLAVDGIKLTRSGPEGMTMTVSDPVAKIPAIREACDKLAKLVAEETLLESPEEDVVAVTDDPPEEPADEPTGDETDEPTSPPEEPATPAADDGNGGATGNSVTV